MKMNRVQECLEDMKNLSRFGHLTSTAQSRQWYPNKEYARSSGLILIEVVKEGTKGLSVNLHSAGPTPPHDASTRIVDLNCALNIPSCPIIT
jgi:hypothetical protein